MIKPPIGTVISAPPKAPLRVHVNQHHIRKNISTPDPEEKLPVITIKKGHQNIYCNGLEIDGKITLVYGEEKTLLSCGARVIIETNSEITITQ